MNSAAGLVAVGIFVGGIIAGVIKWLVDRRYKRMDALELAVFGDGVNPGIHKFVTHAVLDARISDLKSSLQGISEEGVRREERILAAIDNVRDVVGSEVMETKAGVRELNKDLNKRIDDILHRFGPQR